MRSLVSIALFLSAAPKLASAGPWDTLLRHECGGTIELLPLSPAGLQVDISNIISTVDAVAGRVENRMKCSCPDSTSDIKLDVGHIVLNAFGPNSESWAAKCGNVASEALDAMNFIDINLPETCTVSSYMGGNGCKLQYELPEYQMNLALAIKKCAASRVPQFSVHCSGAGCSSFLKPCNNDQGCAGGQKCIKAPDFSRKNISDVLSFFGLCPNGQLGCFQNSDNPNPENDLLSNILTWVGQNIYSSSAPVADLQLCGLEIFSSPPSAAFTPEAVTMNMVTTGGGDPSSDGTQPAQTSTWDGSMTLNYLKAFSGFLSQAPTTNVLTAGLGIPAISITGSGPTTGKYNVLKATCDKQIMLGENILRAKLSPIFDQLLTKILQKLKSTQDCRTPGGTTESDFLRRFGMWSLDFWFQKLDSSADALFPVEPRIPFFPDTLGILFQMPSSCSFKSWMTTGSCSLSYTGLNSLMMMDITLNLNVKKCPDSGGQMSFDLSCTGANCGLLLGAPKTCTSNSGCPSGSSCMDPISSLTAPLSATYTVGGNGSFIQETSFLPVDVLGLIFPKCSNQQLWQEDLQAVLSAVLRQTAPSTGTAKYCVADPQAVTAKSGEWMTAQFSQMQSNGGVMVLPGVQSTSTDPTGAASSLVPPTIYVLVLLLWTIMLI